MLANGDPALTTVQPSLEKINLAAPLTPNPEASDKGVPCQVSLIEKVDCSLRDFDHPAHGSLKQKA